MAEIMRMRMFKMLLTSAWVKIQQEAEAAWKLTTTVLRKAWHVNQIFELVLEQCVANYYRDNTKYNREIIS